MSDTDRRTVAGALRVKTALLVTLEAESASHPGVSQQIRIPFSPGLGFVTVSHKAVGKMAGHTGQFPLIFGKLFREIAGNK